MKNMNLWVKRSVLLFLLAVILQPAVVKATVEPYIPEKTTFFVTSELISRNWNLQGVTSTKDVTKLKSSNNKVATVSKFDYNGSVYVGVTVKKAGKTTVSFTAKVNGKKKNYKCAVTVKKYANPFSSFKIGTANIAKRLNETDGTTISLKKTKKNQKVSFKLKKNWPLAWASFYNSADGQNMVSVKNGTKLQLKKGRQLQMALQYKDGTVLDIFVVYK